jgi:uracil-DNA glycosylase
MRIQDKNKPGVSSQVPRPLSTSHLSTSAAKTLKSKTSTAPLPPQATLDQSRAAAAHCKACDLWKTGTQTVFGEGSENAKVMLVGEQPGDREDRAGRPFVGPAGMLLNRALEKAGIDRSEVYVTNVVKHFKWVRDERGKRRIHKKPDASEINACRPWLDSELSVIKPQILVCLGATAAQALLGRNFSVSRQRGQLIQSTLAPYVMATVHPSSLLRMPEEKDRHAEMARFVEDLRKVARLIHSTAKAA